MQVLRRTSSPFHAVADVYSCKNTYINSLATMCIAQQYIQYNFVHVFPFSFIHLKLRFGFNGIVAYLWTDKCTQTISFIAPVPVKPFFFFFLLFYFCCVLFRGSSKRTTYGIFWWRILFAAHTPYAISGFNNDNMKKQKKMEKKMKYFGCTCGYYRRYWMVRRIGRIKNKCIVDCGGLLLLVAR